jgi:hypothetical protein
MSIQESKVYLGVDVASKHLDLFFPDTGKPERIKNHTDAIKALCVRIQGLSQQEICGRRRVRVSP